MAIKGLTDKDRSDRTMLGRIEIRVFKGGRKGERSAGKTLKDNYRICTENNRIRKLLSASYGQPNADGDILTDHLNIYFPFDEPERTFATAMKAFSLSGLETVCDREVISQETQTTNDAKGNVHRSIVSCNKPCPVAGQAMSVKCMKGCQPTGELFFYIRELYDADIIVPARMTVRSYNDIDYITSRLNQMLVEIGSITNSLFPCFRTRHKVPFVLTRSKITIKRPVLEKETYLRTGKNTDGESWAVELNPNQDYMELLRAWRMTEELKRLSVAIPPQTIAGLLQGDASAMQYIDVEAQATTVQSLPQSTNKALPSSDQRLITKDEWNATRRMFDERNWTKDMIVTLLQDKFEVNQAGELTVKQLLELEKIASDQHEYEYWRGQTF